MVYQAGQSFPISLDLIDIPAIIGDREWAVCLWSIGAFAPVGIIEGAR